MARFGPVVASAVNPPGTPNAVLQGDGLNRVVARSVDVAEVVADGDPVRSPRVQVQHDVRCARCAGSLKSNRRIRDFELRHTASRERGGIRFVRVDIYRCCASICDDGSRIDAGAGDETVAAITDETWHAIPVVIGCNESRCRPVLRVWKRNDRERRWLHRVENREADRGRRRAVFAIGHGNGQTCHAGSRADGYQCLVRKGVVAGDDVGSHPIVEQALSR